MKQLSFIPELAREDKLEMLENTIDNIRNMYGHFSVQRGLMIADKELANFNPVSEHIIYPVAFRT